MNLDDLELELRRLPGVVATAFDVHDASVYVQLHVTGPAAGGLEPGDAARVAARHLDRPVEIEIVRVVPSGNGQSEPPAPATAAPGTIEVTATRTSVTVDEDDITLDLSALEATAVAPVGPRGEGGRPRLLAVLSFPDTDELEVHVVHEERRSIGRAAVSRGLAGAVEATLDALHQLGARVPARLRWARTVDHDGTGVLVAVALDDADTLRDTDAPRAPCYGLAAGTSPVEAAARASLHALNRRLTRRA